MQSSGSLWLDWCKFLPLVLGIRRAEPAEPLLNQVFTRDFPQYYRQQIMPVIPYYERLRRKALRAFRLRFWWFTLCWWLRLLLAPLMMVLHWLLRIPRFDHRTAMLNLQQLWRCYAPIEEYRQRVKTEVYPGILKSLGEEWEYHPQGEVPVSTFVAHLPVPKYTMERSYDYLCGQHKGIALEFVAAELYQQKTIPQCVFKGFFLYCRLKKPFEGEVIVKPKQQFMAFLGGNPPKEMQEIHLEDTVFCSRFDVWGTDQVHARRILTPSVMQRILRLTDTLDNRKLLINFKQQGVLFMMPSEYNHLAEPSVLRRVNFIRECNLVLAAVQDICRMVEVMRLHRRTTL